MSSSTRPGADSDRPTEMDAPGIRRGSVPQLQMVSWGANENGQLGVGDMVTRIRPQVLSESVHPAVIACGSRFTVVLSKEGHVYTHGRGDDGQLGYNTNLQMKPQVVPAFADKVIVDVAARGSHALAVDNAGRVYSWGRGDDGQLGDRDEAPPDESDPFGARSPQFEPRVVRTLAESVAIGRVACGRMFSLAVSVDARNIYSWGCGDDGSLGHGNYVSHETPKRLEGFPLADQVVDLCCGSRHTLCMLSDGSLFSWGWGIYGQLGTGDRESRPAPTFVVFPTLDNRGHGNRPASHSHDINSTRPITFATSTRQHASSTAAREAAQAAMSPISSLVNTPARSQAIDIASSLGSSNGGGSGGTYNSYDERANRNTSQAMRDANDAEARDARYASSGGRQHRAGSEPKDTLASKPSFVNYAEYAVIKIAAGYRHSMCCVRRLSRQESSLLSSSSLNLRDAKYSETTADCTFKPEDVQTLGWGWNQYGQLGRPSSVGWRVMASRYCLTPQPIPALTGRPILALAAGGRHSLCVVASAANVAGQANAGAVTRRSSTDLAAAEAAAAAEAGLVVDLQLQPTIEVLTWGRGDDGQLGLADVASRAEPTNVVSGMLLPDCTVHDVRVSCGWAHTTAVLGLETGSAAKLQAAQDTVAAGPRHRWFDPRGWFVVRDLDGICSQLLGGLTQMLLTVQLLVATCGMPADVALDCVIPAMGLAYLLGNGFFWGQGLRMKIAEGRNDVTSQIHGISIVLLYAYALLVMKPVYDETGDYKAAYGAGCFAGAITGLMQLVTVPIVRYVVKIIPREAMLSTVAGVSLTYISLNFLFEIYQSPSYALFPMLFCLFIYASNTRLPFNLPAGLASLVIGTLLAWILIWLDKSITTYDEFQPMAGNVSVHFMLPPPQFEILFNAFKGQGWAYIPVIFPMFLVNLVQNLANIETAHTVGDRFSRWQSLVADAVVTIIGACFGNPFPTNIFIGQSAFKASGIRTGYALGSALILAALGFSGAMTAVAKYIPLPAGVGFLMWIGILVTKQAFAKDANAFDYSAAVVVGLLPPIAAWALAFITGTVDAMHAVMANNSVVSEYDIQLLTNYTNLESIAAQLSLSGTFVYGIMSLSQGYLLIGIILSSCLVFVLDRRFEVAAVWMALGAVFSFFGIIHSFRLEGNEVKPELVRFASLGTVHCRLATSPCHRPLMCDVYVLVALVPGCARCFRQHQRFRPNIHRCVSRSVPLVGAALLFVP